MTSTDLWRQFSHDPRDPAHAAMRASDADRDVVQRALGEAYSEGRLTAIEFDERSSAVVEARTLGEFPAFLGDLVPSTAVPAVASMSSSEVDAQAVAQWQRSRREATSMWLFVTTICWVIWLATDFGGHPWPIYPMLGTSVPLLGTLVRRTEIIDDNRRKIIAKQEKAIAKAERKRRELEGPSDGSP